MQVIKVETNQKRNMFFHETTISPKEYKENIENRVINMFPDYSYQNFLGFGGAFTEASGICYSNLPQSQKDSLIKDYFSTSGLNYTLGRIPIGSTDFSKKSYSYAEKKDLSDFSIKKDENYIIPFIKDALTVCDIKFLASPWSPPKFMKQNKMLILGGILLDKYKKTYVEYLVKFIQSYERMNIPISFITVQNEPNATQPWESCRFTSEQEAEFVKKFLYPEFLKNNIKAKIFIWDHNKEKLFQRANSIINDPIANEAISGIAYHYYSGDHFESLKLTKEVFPNKLLFHTEGCTGHSFPNSTDELKNAEIYAHDIIGDLNNGCNAYIDWNLVLDYKGGPNHKHNYCNAPIMMNKDDSGYNKSLVYYYIGHFSKYIKPNAKRIAFSKYTDMIEVTAFINEDNSIAVVLFNKNNINKEYNLVIGDKVIHDNLDSHAIVTYIIK